MNYKLTFCGLCWDWHRPSQPQNHKMFHTDPFGTRYIPVIPDQRCSNCNGLIKYDRTWGGWHHLPGTLQKHGYRQCLITPAVWMSAQPSHVITGE